MSNIHLVNRPIMCVLIVLCLHYPSSFHTNKNMVDAEVSTFFHKYAVKWIKVCSYKNMSIYWLIKKQKRTVKAGFANS